jgi:phage terminase large subunit GpA-like protein
MIPICDASVSLKYKGVIAVMGTQMGKTANLLNIVGRKVDDDPAPVLWIGPTKSNVESVIEPQLEQMITHSTSLSAKRVKGKRKRKLAKMIAGVMVRLAWAGSATELASQPAHTVVVDERDKMKPIPGEGDPFALAEARKSNYADGIVVGTSSPTDGNVETFIHETTGFEHWAPADADDIASPIWKLWQSGTRHEFAWQCPHCSEWFIPRFRLLTGWDEGSSAIVAKRKAVVACPRNGCQIEDRYKQQMNEGGRFVSPGQSIDADGNVQGEGIESEYATFWVSGLCSPWVSFGERAHAWVRAARSHDQETIRVVINTGFGELYRTRGEAPPWEVIKAISDASAYNAGDVPKQVQLIFLTVDVQKDRLVCVVRGWGSEFESWLIHREELWGDTDAAPVWERLDQLFDRKFGDSAIDAAAVDSGYRTERVYAWCERHQGRSYAIKGREKPQRLYSASDIEVNRMGKRLFAGMKLWTIDDGYFKGWVHDRIGFPQDQPGAWHLHKNVGEDYCKQIVAEQRMKAPSGRQIWVKRSTNDFLDAEKMQVFLAHVEGVRNLVPLGDDDAEPEDQTSTLTSLASKLNSPDEG